MKYSFFSIIPSCLNRNVFLMPSLSSSFIFSKSGLNLSKSLQSERWPISSAAFFSFELFTYISSERLLFTYSAPNAFNTSSSSISASPTLSLSEGFANNPYLSVSFKAFIHSSDPSIASSLTA